MRSTHSLLHWRLLLVFVLVLGNAMVGTCPVLASATVEGSAALADPTGSVTSAVTPSNGTPNIGDTIVVTINIDMTGVNAPDDYLGGFTGSLDWNTAVLSFVSHTSLPGGFTGNINHAGSATGHIAFNGANAEGANGNIIVFTVTFSVVGAGTSPLDLGYSSMAAATTFTDLLPILTVTDGQVVVAGPSTPTATATPVTPTWTPTATSTATPTATRTLTPTRTQTQTPTITPTATKTATSTATRTLTPTPTQTGVPTNTPTATSTATSTATRTLTPTPTQTRIPTNTPTATSTATSTATRTLTPTPTQTQIPTDTRTPTATSTATTTPTRTLTPTPTNTATATATATDTRTPTATSTATMTPTRTLTPTATRTLTPSPTPTQTLVPTVTPTVVPGLAVRKVDAVDPIEAGSHIKYTIYISNTAGSAINDIWVVDVLPSGTYYLSSNPSGQYSDNTVGWSISSLNAVASTVLLLELGTYSTSAGTVTNNVTASAPGAITANDSETTTIVAPPATATPTATRTATPIATYTATWTPIPSRTATATGVPTITYTPEAPTDTPVATFTSTPTGVLTATPTVTATPPSMRYWLYLPLLLKTPLSQGHQPHPGVLGR